MNAVVYARYSSHKQGEQSIEGQLAEARKFALEHGLTIIHEYADRAMTGRNDNREQFQLMLADSSKKAFDALIIWKTDRIGRNKEEIALNKYHLKKNGVKIFYIAEHIPDSPEGIILESVIEGMAGAAFAKRQARPAAECFKSTEHRWSASARICRRPG